MSTTWTTGKSEVSTKSPRPRHGKRLRSKVACSATASASSRYREYPRGFRGDKSIASDTNIESSGSPIFQLPSRENVASEFSWEDLKREGDESVSAYGDPAAQDSEEDDMDLFDYSAETEEPLDPDHAFAKVVSPLRDHCLSVLRTRIQNDREGWARATTNRSRRKRVKFEGTETWMEADWSGRIDGEETILIKTPRPVRGSFACPFYIREPSQHQACLTRTDIRSIRDVKQHLWTAHRRPSYCPVCLEIFSTAAACDEHIRNRSCDLNTTAAPEGLTQQQMQQLARRLDPWSLEESQWYSIWRIVFPGNELPSFPYLSGKTESLVLSVRELWAEEGQRLISDFLEGQGLQGYDVSDEERSLKALHSLILNQMIDQLVGDIDCAGSRGC